MCHCVSLCTHSRISALVHSSYDTRCNDKYSHVIVYVNNLQLSPIRQHGDSVVDSIIYLNALISQAEACNTKQLYQRCSRVHIAPSLHSSACRASLLEALHLFTRNVIRPYANHHTSAGCAVSSRSRSQFSLISSHAAGCLRSMSRVSFRDGRSECMTLPFQRTEQARASWRDLASLCRSTVRQSSPAVCRLHAAPVPSALACE